MAWGGSLNKKGSDYVRKIREADRVLKFLEEIKKDLDPVEKETIAKTIEIIVSQISKISEQKQESNSF
jgi:hypothetical protein